jgi:hypothetical protein
MTLFSAQQAQPSESTKIAAQIEQELNRRGYEIQQDWWT